MGGSPFINEILTLHLDPLSASVSEAFRKSSARIKKSVVDPLAAANPLFRTSGSQSAATASSLDVNDGGSSSVPKGMYRPPSTVVSSAASSVVSLVKSNTMEGIGCASMQRSGSNSSSSTTNSGMASAETGAAAAKAANVRTSEDQTTLRDGDSSSLGSTPTGLKKKNNSELEDDDNDDEDGFKSILDSDYPTSTHDMDESIQKILVTLGLITQDE
jgi:hypothetical protein